MKVALVVMPFADTDRPSLAVGLLQAALEREGFECDAKYFNLTFESLLGRSAYQTVSRVTMTALAGEWVFSQAYYGERFSTWESYRREVLSDPTWGMDPEHWDAIHAARKAAPGFLRLALESNDWSRYDLVGFTSTFEQTLASLCLARRIRERHPEVLIALGGANFEAGMARPYMESFGFLDFISTGEADRSFPALCKSLRAVRGGEARQVEVPPGFLYRRGRRVCGGPATAGDPVELDDLPTPNYDDFFRVLAANGKGRGRTANPGEDPSLWLTMETARGCWWGQKAHCTFCGLNGKTLTFRKKSWRRVVEEHDELIARHGGLPTQFADNILGMEFFDDLLPFWASRGNGGAKFFETKANLRRRHLELLRSAGVVYLQPGVESLADGTLRVMRKGVTAAQNVALIRWCAEMGIRPYWNVIYGFPHERLDDYEHNAALLWKLTHLPPPSAIGPIRLDRFSPNFMEWRQQGFTAIAPLPAYRHVFPFPEETLGELAYYFDYQHPQREAAREAGQDLERFGHRWRQTSQRGDAGEMAVKPHWQGGFVLVDRRFNFEPSARRLSALELALLLACDAPATRERALEIAAPLAQGEPGGEASAEAALGELLETSVIAEVGARLVTLPLLPDPERLAAGSPWRGRASGAMPGRAD